MIQTTNVQDPCRQQRCGRPATIINSDYNAVKIAINGASVNAPSANAQTNSASRVYAEQQNRNGYVGEGMPVYYDYPQANIYDYQKTEQQGYYAPVEKLPFVYAPAAEDIVKNYCICPACGTVLPSKAITSVNTPINAEVPQPQMVIQNPVSSPVIQPQVMQQNINSAVASAPAPVITEAKKADEDKVKQEITVQNTVTENTSKVEIKEPEELKPQIDINAFIAELTNPDFNKQALTMEAIALIARQEPDKLSDLLDERVINSLNDILNADTKDLIGPTKEQTEARIKANQGKKLSDAEKEFANTITPLEQAERNKCYALYTMAILEKHFGNEVEKLSGQVVPFKDLPGVNSVVEQMSSNNNSIVRASAVEALSFIQRDEYKDDLNSLFKIALNDPDKSVRDTAQAAIDKLNKA